MSWVSIDEEKCNGCGICVLRCPRCFIHSVEKIKVDANEKTCILCGHCVSLCPTEAVTHHKLNTSEFIKLGKETTFDTETFIQFLKERRSHRHFLDKKIPQEDLEALIDVCRWAPTGSNVQNVEMIVYQNQDKIEKLSDLVIDYFIGLTDRVKKRLARLESEGKQNTEDYTFTLRLLDIGTNMSVAKASGLDPIFYKAPVLMIFHSIAQTSTPKDNSVLIAHTLALTARTMGIESCYIGLMEIAANDHPPIVKELNLPLDHKVFSSMVLGYPKLKFLTTVDRKPLKVRWE
ncbi:MAG: nitroreductase family protein [Thermodesulfobacteriota bacterium]|nr:nitroreductase family protein [Thermodesulfobacteriota bacterium]